VDVPRTASQLGGRAHLRCRAGGTVVVGGEDHDRGGEGDDGDHRDGEQRAQLPVVGAEYDRGVLCSVWLLGGKGAVYWQSAREQAWAEADKALALSRRAGQPTGIADALLGSAVLDAAESLPHPRRGALAQEALPHAREAGDDSLVALALSERARALPPEEAAAEIEEAAAALRKVGDSRHLVTLYSDVAYNAIKHGSPERARPMLEQALSLARQHGDPVELAYLWGNVGLEALSLAISIGRGRHLKSSFDWLGRM
jgi:hypothetical protein